MFCSTNLTRIHVLHRNALVTHAVSDQYGTWEFTATPSAGMCSLLGNNVHLAHDSGGISHEFGVVSMSSNFVEFLLNTKNQALERISQVQHYQTRTCFNPCSKQGTRSGEEFHTSSGWVLCFRTGLNSCSVQETTIVLLSVFFLFFFFEAELPLNPSLYFSNLDAVQGKDMPPHTSSSSNLSLC